MSKKIPRNALSAKAKKRTRQHEVVDGGANKNPIWRFCCLDKDIPLNYSDSMEVLEILDKLKSYESMTWIQIEQATGSKSSGNASHYIDPSDIEKVGRKRIGELPDYDFSLLYSLALRGKHRLWGLRDKETFQILWYDPNHEICKIKKR